MSRAPLLLEYAGPIPSSERPSFLFRCWRLVWALIVFVIVAAVVIVRAALLVSGVACVFAGTILLTLGGRRDAAERLTRWRARTSDLVGLWWSDILRPIRSRFRRRELAA